MSGSWESSKKQYRRQSNCPVPNRQGLNGHCTSVFNSEDVGEWEWTDPILTPSFAYIPFTISSDLASLKQVLNFSLHTRPNKTERVKRNNYVQVSGSAATGNCWPQVRTSIGRNSNLRTWFCQAVSLYGIPLVQSPQRGIWSTLLIKLPATPTLIQEIPYCFQSFKILNPNLQVLFQEQPEGNQEFQWVGEPLSPSLLAGIALFIVVFGAMWKNKTDFTPFDLHDCSY